MLKILHHHIYAGKLQALFDKSSIVLVYQSLGSISADTLKSQLESTVAAKHPQANVTADAFRIRNAVALGTKDESFSRFFQATNVVVGWQLPPSSPPTPTPAPGTDSSDSASSSAPSPSSLSQSLANAFRSTRRSTIVDLCGDFQERQPQHRVQQRVLADVLEASLKLAGSQPVALLAAFHKSKCFTATQLQEWSKLDEAQVLGELLGTLEGVAGPLLYLEDAAAGVADTLEQAAGSDLAAALDQAAAREQPDPGAAGAAAAAP